MKFILLLKKAYNYVLRRSPKYQPYFSIDLETTGLPHEGCSILQLAVIFNDGKGGNVYEMPYLNVIIDNGGDIEKMNWNDYARKLNQWIVDEIQDRRDESVTCYPVVNLEEAQKLFKNFVEMNVQEHNIEREHEGLEPIRRFSVAGKNAAGFDIPLLNTWNFHMKNFMHRVVDPGPMFFHVFGFIPSLDDIKKKYPKRFDRSVVSHDAYEDAIDVILAERIAKDL